MNLNVLENYENCRFVTIYEPFLSDGCSSPNHQMMVSIQLVE